jgi:hypothetical protein
MVLYGTCESHHHLAASLGAYEVTQFCMSGRNFNEYGEYIRQHQTKFGRPGTQDLCSPDIEVFYNSE